MIKNLFQTLAAAIVARLNPLWDAVRANHAAITTTNQTVATMQQTLNQSISDSGAGANAYTDQEVGALKTLLVDHTKFGRTSYAIVAALSAFDRLITDDRTPHDAIENLREQGVEVMIAPRR